MVNIAKAFEILGKIISGVDTMHRLLMRINVGETDEGIKLNKPQLKELEDKLRVVAKDVSEQLKALESEIKP